MRCRGGFSLIELLVATGVFLVGFVAVFGLFLAGMRFRKLAEDTTRASLAASSLIAEFQIDAGSEAIIPCQPSQYVGDGFPDIARPGETADPPATAIKDSLEKLYPYTGQRNLYYRVVACTDLKGGDDAATTALRIRLFVLPWASVDDTVDLMTLNRRLGLSMQNDTSDEVRATLVKRGLAMAFDAVIVRKPSWR
jgi:type II secretory pathway pseudopilin PulG